MPSIQLHERILQSSARGTCAWQRSAKVALIETNQSAIAVLRRDSEKLRIERPGKGDGTREFSELTSYFVTFQTLFSFTEKKLTAFFGAMNSASLSLNARMTEPQAQLREQTMRDL